MKEEELVIIDELKELCKWVSSIKPKDLPEKVIRRAKWVLLDDIGAILAGSLAPEVSSLIESYLVDQNTGPSTILSNGFQKTNIYTAAELNGILGCWEELDEGFRLATSHAGIYTIPALLSLAESKQSTLEEVLTALVVGYEFGARFAEAWQFEPLLLHPHGVFVTIASAAACAKLLNFNDKEIFDVVNTASALSIASPYSHAVEGALVRNIWTGVGARIGLLVVEGYKSKITGLDKSTFDVFSSIYKGRFVEGTLKKELGTRFAIMYGYHKAYACCQYAHSALDALLEIRRDNQDKVDNVKEIRVKIHPKGLSLNNVHPKTTLGAKFSIPHAIASGWVIGNVGRDAFKYETLTDPVISKLRENVKMELLESNVSAPYDRPAEITMIFNDGTRITKYMDSATGDPDKPFNEKMLFSKFLSTASDVIRDPQKVIDFIFNESSKLKINRLFKIFEE